jgi:hypothetical protein
MNLLMPVKDHIYHDHKTNNSIRREIQTEGVQDMIDKYRKKLAFIPANIATQLHPFKIIPLQSTRKENKRETLARAAVTLETEQVKR